VICPSDRIESGDRKDRMISYGCNGGLPDNYAGDIAANGLDWPQNCALDARFPGIMPTPVPKIHPRPSIGTISQADGTSNTILFGENSDLDVWDHPRTEAETCILWQDGLNSNAVGQILNKPPKTNGVDVPLTGTIGDLYVAQPELAEAYARPSSQHPTGFHIAFCDGHSRFASETMDYTVYARIMTSNGKKFKQAGINTPPLPRPRPTHPVGVQQVQVLQETPVSDLD
jgi:prepilin-type processing-associated H-X9-DG protein